MKKVIIITIILLLSYYLINLYDDYYYHQLMINNTVKDISIKASGIEVKVEDNTEWITILKGVGAILLTYIGIRLTNKIIK